MKTTTNWEERKCNYKNEQKKKKIDVELIWLSSNARDFQYLVLKIIVSKNLVFGDRKKVIWVEEKSDWKLKFSTALNLNFPVQNFSKKTFYFFNIVISEWLNVFKSIVLEFLEKNFEEAV